jgi:hypothetical protein
MGIPIGLWAGSSLRYPVSEVQQFVGFPIPVAVFQFENGRWVDYVGNPFVVLLNASIVGAVFLVPVSIALILRSLQGSSSSAASKE